MRRWPILSSLILSLLALSACGTLTTPAPTAIPSWPTPRVRATPGPGERVWEISGGFWEQATLSGAFAGAEAGATHGILARMAVLRPGSPSASSRRVALTLACGGREDLTVWLHDEANSRTERFGCGESMTVYFSYDANYQRLVVRRPSGVDADMVYTLTAEIHAPY